MKAIFVALFGLSAVQACNDLTLPNGMMWHDAGGSKFNCTGWYTKAEKCEKDGGKFHNFGMAANDACCVCNGGDTGSFANSGNLCEMDTSWVHSKYGDTCQDYMPLGKSHKWHCDPEAKKNCCSCPEEAVKLAEPVCMRVADWKHPTYDDECADYDEGGNSHKYECDPEVKKNCCTCGLSAASQGSSFKCANKQLDGAPWTDIDGYDCAYYSEKDRCARFGSKYDNGGLVAKTACCACGGGEEDTCEDLTNADETPWHDEYGPKYDCEWYSKAMRCIKSGSTVSNADGVNAKMACCTCGGGNKEGALADKEPPKPDEGDDVQYEWMGNTKFRHKKHLMKGFILYWKVDEENEILTLGLLSPPNMGNNDWIGLGFSPDGMMADSDAVVAWFDKETGAAKITDYYFQNQSPNGIKLLERQDIAEPELFWHANNRLGLTFSRPWFASSGGIELRIQQSFVEAIYGHGKTSKVCGPHGFCNHQFDDRGGATLAFTVPSGMSVYQLNRGLLGEPCNGPAKLECYDGFTCYHPDAFDGDYFKANYEYYGECTDPTVIGDETIEIDDNAYEDVPQNVFPGGGGFQNSYQLRGGFEVLWTVDRTSQPGSFHPDDSITVAFISTRGPNQGWIGAGWSPNGEMKGSDVVIGWRDGENMHLGDYFLEAQVAATNFEANKQDLEYAQVIKKNGQTCLTFTRKLTPANSVQILEGEVHFIFAHGPLPDKDDINYIPYHRYRQHELVEFMPEPEDLDGQNAGEREVCGGANNIKCRKAYGCNMFSEAMLTRWMGMMSGNTTNNWSRPNNTDNSGYTAASADRGGGSRNNRTSIWSRGADEIMELRGSGMCMKLEEMDDYDMDTFNYTAFREAKALVEDEWPNKLELRWGFFLYWKVDGDFIDIALVAESHRGGWMGLGMGAGEYMIGANAVIGWEDGENSNSKINEYYLQNKLPWEIQPIYEGDSSSMGVTDMKVFKEGIQNALTFRRPLIPASGLSPIVPGPIDIIFANGNTPLPVDDYFGYHRFRDHRKVTFIPLPEDSGEGDGE